MTSHTGANQPHLAFYIGYTAMHYLILLPGICKHIICSGRIFSLQLCLMTQHALRQIKITTAPRGQWEATGWPNPPLRLAPGILARFLNKKI